MELGSEGWEQDTRNEADEEWQQVEGAAADGDWAAIGLDAPDASAYEPTSIQHFLDT